MRNLSVVHEISDLRTRAVPVYAPASQAAPCVLSERQVARCLAGAVHLGIIRWGLVEVQLACAELVRHERAWRTSLGDLPAEPNGCVRESVQVLAILSRSLLALAGADAVRAALAFWASERDPAVWMSVAG